MGPDWAVLEPPFFRGTEGRDGSACDNFEGVRKGPVSPWSCCGVVDV